MLAKSQSSTVILITIALVWTWIWVLWSSFVTKESDYGVESSRNDPPKRTPPLLVHASAMFDGMLHLQYSYSDGLIGMPPSINASLAESRSFACPSPRSALIGILTTAQPANTARRNALRHIYSQFQRTSNSSVDIVYFFGSASDDARNHQLSLEKSIYDDIVVTSRKEARDYGKILDWFEYARDHAYTWVPTDAANPSFGSKGKGIWCRKYNFIAKGDDDSIIHIPRLEKLLGTLNMSTSHFVGASFQDVTQFEREFVEGMHGMLYLVSSEIAEWIRHSPIPLTHVVGVEDQQVALWLKMSKIAFNRVGVKVSQFHDFEGTDAIYGGRAVDDYKHRATPETIVLHNCKYLTTFYTCMSEILESRDVSINKFNPLMSWTGAKAQCQKLKMPCTDQVAKSAIESLHLQLLTKRFITKDEYDTTLTKSFTRSFLENRIRVNVTNSVLAETVSVLVLNQPLYTHNIAVSENNVTEMILELFADSKGRELGLEIADETLSAIGQKVRHISDHKPLEPNQFESILLEFQARACLTQFGISPTLFSSMDTTLSKLQKRPPADDFRNSVLREFILDHARARMGVQLSSDDVDAAVLMMHSYVPSKNTTSSIKFTPDDLFKIILFNSFHKLFNGKLNLSLPREEVMDLIPVSTTVSKNTSLAAIHTIAVRRMVTMRSKKLRVNLTEKSRNIVADKLLDGMIKNFNDFLLSFKE